MTVLRCLNVEIMSRFGQLGKSVIKKL